jgi:Tol biopolymer transport system component
VAFQSVASNLVPGDTNVTNDVFIRDRTLGTTIRVSVDTSGNQSGIGQPSIAPSLSPDGKAVAFATSASFDKGDSNGLRDVYVRAPLR